MRRAIIYNKNNVAIFLFKLLMEFLYPFMKKETVHPTFLLRLITAWKAFDIFKSSWFRRFTDYKHRQLLSSSICSCHSCQMNFAMFTTTALLAFHVQGFLGKSSALYMSFSSYLERIVGRELLSMHLSFLE